MSAARPSLNPEEIQAAIDMAGDRELLRDQQGRYWSRWHAAAPECAATCGKCGAVILDGYLLRPEAKIKICERHVKRWL